MRRGLEVGKAYEWEGWIFVVVKTDEIMVTVLSLLNESSQPYLPAPGHLTYLLVGSLIARQAVLK